MKFQLEIYETLNRVLVIDAPTREAAIARAQRAYNEEDIILSAGDMVDQGVEVLEDDVPDDFGVDYTVLPGQEKPKFTVKLAETITGEYEVEAHDAAHARSIAEADIENNAVPEGIMEETQGYKILGVVEVKHA